jgi:5'-deoxynucleotidase YfbR-like HD superfamily hydrolase
MSPNKPIGSAIRTYTGKLFDFEHPEKSPINIEDIAHSLSLLCRFAGHCKEFYCVTPETRVLTRNLMWTPAKNIKTGTELIGFDENLKDKAQCGKRRRKLRPSTATVHGIVQRDVYRLCLSDGSYLESSSEHPWLCSTKASQNQVWLTTKEIAEDFAAGKTRKLIRFLKPWSMDESREAGYMAGVLDGEGSVSFKSGDKNGTAQALHVGFSQKKNILLRKACEYLTDHYFSFRNKPNSTNKTVHNVTVKGGWQEQLRLLGSVRPMRLLDKWEKRFAQHYRRTFESFSHPTVVNVEFLGKQDVVALETSSHTYFAEGFGAHNSVAEHSYRVSYIVPEEHALWGLMHDAGECYCVDVPRPLKHLAGMESYRAHEKRVMSAICSWFNMDPTEPPEVKAADNIMLVTEQRDLLANSIPDFNIEPLVEEIKPVSSKTAEEMFLCRFNHLYKP